ncbi:MAG TPA: DUF1294 domain-containing protein [Dehalococcoidia bacterium]|jgi:uncharacterized membrane protein YsdA (DUF1294 family)|nr:DUF1294 domain-containing protein [Dehalococcoidia bacterium]
MEISTGQFALLVVVLLGVINLGSIIAIWWDKRRAVKGKWRVKEETLLVWALVGGWPGGIWAMRRFRHKTSKRSFIAKYVFVVILNVAAVVAVGYLATA